MAESFEQQEYFAVAAAVEELDKRLLTVKGWGVTLSLVALGFGFQYRALGFFLIAAVSSVAFWAVEAATKRHQMRHYLRLREIEVSRYQRAAESERSYSAPRTNWSWERAEDVFRGRQPSDDVSPLGRRPGYGRAAILPHVALPHAITFATSVGLLLGAFLEQLPGFQLGAPP